MARALRITRLKPPALPFSVPDPVDRRTRRPSRSGQCQRVNAGHNGHWIPATRSAKDPVGWWGVVTSVADVTFVVLYDDGTRGRLAHHDLAQHGGQLLAEPRVFVQLRWSMLWSGELGICVTESRAYRPCA